jgi:hypothetical protein
MFFEDGDRRGAYHARTLFPDANRLNIESSKSSVVFLPEQLA